MPEFETPLENLFLYIRDIFGNPTICTEFEKEKNNEKAKDINYWDFFTRTIYDRIISY